MSSELNTVDAITNSEQFWMSELGQHKNGCLFGQALMGEGNRGSTHHYLLSIECRKGEITTIIYVAADDLISL